MNIWPPMAVENDRAGLVQARPGPARGLVPEQLHLRRGREEPTALRAGRGLARRPRFRAPRPRPPGASRPGCLSRLRCLSHKLRMLLRTAADYHRFRAARTGDASGCSQIRQLRVEPEHERVRAAPQRLRPTRPDRELPQPGLAREPGVPRWPWRQEPVLRPGLRPKRLPGSPWRRQGSFSCGPLYTS